MNTLKLYLITLFFCLLQLFSFAQKDSCKFILIDSFNINNNNYFLAANVNGWKANDENYKFKKDLNGTNYLVCYFKKGTLLQYKFTKGNWDEVEVKKGGGDIENRVLNIDTAHLIFCKIEGWKNNSSFVKKHTVSTNVKILDTAFFIPQLNCKRRIWIYLPPNYNSSNKKYPVLYMQDGQNLFDNATSGFGEWGVDEFMDSIAAQGKLTCIIIGIENGKENRMSEYNPYLFNYNDINPPQTILPLGNEYVQFLALTLKPFIDKHYRTLTAKENTIIAGSSMGGLISYYATLKYKNIFGKVGVFSPAFWTAPTIKLFTDSVANNNSNKFFFYLGALEGEKYLNDMNNVIEKLAAKSNGMIYAVIDSTGKHNEAAWQKWFPEFYNWIMADGFNYVLKLEEY